MRCGAVADSMPPKSKIAQLAQEAPPGCDSGVPQRRSDHLRVRPTLGRMDRVQAQRCKKTRSCIPNAMGAGGARGVRHVGLFGNAPLPPTPQRSGSATFTLAHTFTAGGPPAGAKGTNNNNSVQYNNRKLDGMALPRQAHQEFSPTFYCVLCACKRRNMQHLPCSCVSPPATLLLRSPHTIPALVPAF